MLVLTIGILAPLTPLVNILSAVFGFAKEGLCLSQTSTLSYTVALSLELLI